MELKISKEILEQPAERIKNKHIEFKVWHPDQGKMYEFDSFEDISFFQGNDIYRHENKGSVTFLQFTGFHDTKSEKIFEGDILRFVWNDGTHGIAIVFPYKGAFALEWIGAGDNRWKKFEGYTPDFLFEYIDRDVEILIISNIFQCETPCK